MVAGQLQQSATGQMSPRGQQVSDLGSDIGSHVSATFQALLNKVAQEHSREVAELKARLNDLAQSGAGTANLKTQEDDVAKRDVDASLEGASDALRKAVASVARSASAKLEGEATGGPDLNSQTSTAIQDSAATSVPPPPLSMVQQPSLDDRDVPRPPKTRPHPLAVPEPPAEEVQLLDSSANSPASNAPDTASFRSTLSKIRRNSAGRVTEGMPPPPANAANADSPSVSSVGQDFTPGMSKSKRSSVTFDAEVSDPNRNGAAPDEKPMRSAISASSFGNSDDAAEPADSGGQRNDRKARPVVGKRTSVTFEGPEESAELPEAEQSLTRKISAERDKDFFTRKTSAERDKDFDTHGMNGILSRRESGESAAAARGFGAARSRSQVVGVEIEQVIAARGSQRRTSGGTGPNAPRPVLPRSASLVSPKGLAGQKALAKVDTAFTREAKEQPTHYSLDDDDDEGKLDLDGEPGGVVNMPGALRRGASNMLRARSFVSVGGGFGDDGGTGTHNLTTKGAWMPGANIRKLSVKSSGRLTMANLDKKLHEIDRMPEIKYTGPLRHFIAMPTSPRRIAWEFLAALCVAYDVIMVPVTLCFDPTETGLLSGIDWFTLIFWTLNIPLSFFVGVIHDGVLLMSPGRIAYHYIKNWLIIDLLAVGPDWVIKSLEGDRDGAYVKSFRVLRISRTLRLLRLLKLRWILEIINDMLQTEALDIVANIGKMMAILLLMCHYVACIWFAIGNGDGGMWVEHYLIAESSWGDQWLTSFHWAVAQFTQTSMYILPQTRTERVMTVIVVVITLLAFSYTVGAITSYLGQLRSIKEDGSKQLWVARRFLRAHDVPTHLNIRILRYLEKEWERARTALSLEGIPIFTYLSEQLHNELLCAVCLPHLRPHPFFNKVMDLSELVMQRLAARCISQKTLAGGDMLFVPYDSPAHMGTVTRGQITYVKVDLRNREHTYHLEKGKGWVTEHTLWTDDWVCLGEARAETDCELQLVSSETFSEILSPIPNLVNLAGKYAAAFMESLNQTPGDELLDIILLEEVLDLARPVIRDFDAEFANSSPVASANTRPRMFERAVSFFSRGLLSSQ